MIRPGHIPARELMQIGPDSHGDLGRLRSVPAAWFRKTDRELRAHFGFGIDFRNTGTYRTRAMTYAIPGALPGGDHEKGRAVDIRNWRAFVDRDARAFYRILAANGWRNITSDGKPFRTEPWHWVCIKTAAPATTTRRIEEVNVRNYSIFLHKNGDAQAWQLVGDGVRTLITGAAASQLKSLQKQLERGDDTPVLEEAGSKALNAHLAKVATVLGGSSGGGASASAVADELAARLTQ